MKANYKTKYFNDGTITVWNVYEQAWIKRVIPSNLSPRIWDSVTETDRQKWNRHEEKYCE